MLAGKEVAVFTGHTDVFHGVAVTPDGVPRALLITPYVCGNFALEKRLLFKVHTSVVHGYRDQTVRVRGWQRKQVLTLQRSDSVLGVAVTPDEVMWFRALVTSLSVYPVLL